MVLVSAATVGAGQEAGRPAPVDQALAAGLRDQIERRMIVGAGAARPVDVVFGEPPTELAEGDAEEDEAVVRGHDHGLLGEEGSAAKGEEVGDAGRRGDEQGDLNVDLLVPGVVVPRGGGVGAVAEEEPAVEEAALGGIGDGIASVNVRRRMHRTTNPVHLGCIGLDFPALDLDSGWNGESETTGANGGGRQRQMEMARRHEMVRGRALGWGPSAGRILGPRDLADAFARLIFFFKNHGTLLITKYYYRVVCSGCTPELQKSKAYKYYAH
jgi:hypothetical protein